MDPHPDQDHQDKVSLEDLLRLKRMEEPGPEFWDKFDRDLERKRLKTLVAKESWAVRFVHWTVHRAFPVLALGGAAAAVLTLALYFQPTSTGNPLADDSGFASQNPVEPTAEGGIQDALLIAVESPALVTPLDVSRSDFGVDVIAPQPQSYRFNRYTTDMSPKVFRASSDSSVVYLPDTFSAKSGDLVEMNSPLF